ncbi:MAG: flagellar hook assembly protein FlgD [Bdellovibrio sp.]|nr:flagellar hook assembly protein FlgD [Bdellovibrio sp.]
MLPIRGGMAGLGAAESTQAVNTGLSGASAPQKDAKGSARDPQFGEVLKQMQARYGEQPTKPREIKKTLGKDDFLKIMITQMKNQDPTNPFKAEQMAQEIAQFTSVEQLQNVNQNLSKMSTQNRPLEQMAMTGLIGKLVTIDRERFPHLEGQTDSLTFNLPKNGTSVKVSIVSEAGESVFEKDLGAQKAGEVSFTWDGVKTNSLPAKSGSYNYRVEAKDERGGTIQINPKLRAKVIGVSFEGSDPVFLVGDAKHQDKITFKNISQIEVDQSAEAQVPAQAMANSGVGAANPALAVSNPTDSADSTQQKPNFFTFAKGIGSESKDLGMKEQKLADSYMKARAQIEAAPPAPEGFPNGLHDEAAEMEGAKK